MKPKLLRIGDDFIHLADVSRIGRVSELLEGPDNKPRPMEGVSFRLKDGTEARYHGAGVWDAVEAWLQKEAEIVPFALKKTAAR